MKIKKERQQKKVAFFIFVLVITLVLLNACSLNENDTESEKNEDVINLTYANFAPNGTFPTVQMYYWAEELESRTDSQVKVNFFGGGSLLEANNMFNGISNGVADIGLTSTSYEPGRFPLLEIAELPSGYPNSVIASQVINDLINEFPPQALDDFKIITSFATEPSYIQSVDPISDLESINNKQLRIPGALTSILEELGASPIGMSQAQVPEAMQTGVIEGYVSSREILKDMSLAEMTGYVTDYPLSVTIFIAVMNKDTWEELPEDVKEVIDELNEETSRFTGQYLDEHIADTMEWAKNEENLEVVSLTEEEEKKWDEILQPLQDKKVDDAQDEGLPGIEFQERLYELIDKYSNQ